jgi:hypothetical protein
MAVEIKLAPDEKLELVRAQITDTSLNSDYFNVTELSDTFSGGKNAFLIAGSELLEPNTEVKVQIRDSAGKVLYCEFSDGSPDEYYEGISKVVAVYVYPIETSFGPATITLVGQIRDTLDLVKWQRTINIDPSLPNTTRVRFYKRPIVSIVEELSPIYAFDATGSKVASLVTQSFANIKVSQLDTFAGDVKRVKVYRTSEGDISDYDLIQDILVESKELLTTTTLSGSVVGEAGLFTSETLQKLWIPTGITTQLTSSKIDNGVKLSGSGYFTYSSSLDIKSANTYELGIDAFYSASTDSNLGIYLSQLTSSIQNGIQVPITISSSIGTLIGTQPTKNLLDTTFPFKINKDYPSASLYLSQSKGEWHVGNISLKISEDSAFSPSEISFVTSMPTVLGNETYNFKFEFYDVNNNYVPVAVTQSALFTGGNNNIGGTLILISGSTSASNASILALSQSVSGTIGIVTGSVSQSFVTSSFYSASLMSTSLAFSSSASSSISSSKGAAISSSFGNIQTLANGNFSGSFISDTTIFAPVIGGNNGYISNLFKVGTAPSIYLDARQNPRKIFIGGVSDSGSYNNANTTVYMDSGGNFSLGNQLSWNGNALTINGTINVLGGNAATDANALLYAQRAALSGSISASNAQSNAISSASGSAYTMATTSANTAFTNASASAFTQANTAYNNAISIASTDATNKSNAVFTSSAAQVKLLADGGYTGTFISSKEIFAPVIGGTIGYFSNQFRVGDSGIVLDGVNKRIYIGSGTYGNSNTGFYVDNSGNFSLGNKLTFNGSALNVVGAITAESGFIGTAAAGWTIASNKIFNTNVDIDNANNRIDFKSGGIVKTRIKSGNVNIGSTSNVSITVAGAGTQFQSISGNDSAQFGPLTALTTTGGNTVEAFVTTPSGVDGNNLALVIPYPAVTSLGLAQCHNMGTGTSCQYGYDASIFYVVRETNSVGTTVASGYVTVANLEFSNNFTSPFGNVDLPGFGGGTVTIPSIGTAVSGKVYWIQVYLGTVVQARINPNGTTPLTANASLYVIAYGWEARTANATLLAVASRAEFGTNGVQIGSAEGSYVALGDAAGAGNVGVFAGNISVTGTVAAGSVTASDIRAKTNIKTILNGIETIKKLNPVSYDWLQHITGNFEFEKGYGFIADDIQQIMPELIYEKKGYKYDDFKHLDYTSFHAIAIKAIQELIEKVEKLETQISGSI